MSVTTERVGKVIGFGIAGLLTGLGFGAIASMKGSLDSENRKQHSSLQILEDYDPELLKNFWNCLLCRIGTQTTLPRCTEHLSDF